MYGIYVYEEIDWEEINLLFKIIHNLVKPNLTPSDVCIIN